MKGGNDDTSKCTVQAKPGRNGKVVFATLSRLGILLPMNNTFKFGFCRTPKLKLLIFYYDQ